MSNHVMPLKVYFIIFGSLMALTALTVAVAYVDMGVLNTPVALAIAIVKATLVILFFMHVKYSSNLVKIYAAAGFVWLFILLIFSLGDYFSRSWQVPALWYS